MLRPNGVNECHSPAICRKHAVVVRQVMGRSSEMDVVAEDKRRFRSCMTGLHGFLAKFTVTKGSATRVVAHVDQVLVTQLLSYETKRRAVVVKRSGFSDQAPGACRLGMATRNEFQVGLLAPSRMQSVCAAPSSLVSPSAPSLDSVMVVSTIPSLASRGVFTLRHREALGDAQCFGGRTRRLTPQRPNDRFRLS